MLQVTLKTLSFLVLGLALASGESRAQSAVLKGQERAWSGSFFPDLIGGLERASDKSEPLDRKWLRLTGDKEAAAWLEEDLALRRKGFLLPAYWTGYCNGWSMAATRHPLPRDKTVKDAEGRPVHFSSYELQALATWYYAAIPSRDDFETIGRDTTQEDHKFGDNRPLEAHVFHTRLLEDLPRGVAWIADIHIDRRIDNHPILEMDARETLPGEYRTVVTYLDHYYFKKGKWEDGKPSRRLLKRVYRYRITRDAEGRAVSSEWLTKRRPHFMWRMKTAGFAEGFEVLDRLLSE